MFMDTLSIVLVSAALAQLTYGMYLVVDRLCISSLRKVPGPKLAALTGWYEAFYDVVLPGQYVFKIKELHDQYGPTVRISPREVSISDCEFLDTIYNPGPCEKRDKDYEKVKALGISSSVGGAWQHDLHRRRRQSLNNYFSPGAVLRSEHELAKKKQQLAEVFKNGQDMKHLNLSDVYFAFASDVVSQYSFGQNQNLLLNMTRAHGMRLNVQGVLRGVKINLHFAWIRSLIMALPRTLGQYLSPAGTADMIKFRKAIRRMIQAVESETSEATRQAPPSVFRELLSSPGLPQAEKSVHRLEDEGTLLVMAGTESTAKSMTLAHYHLLANPQMMMRLRQELVNSPGVALSELLQLPYLNAVVTEANRLSFGLTGRNPRVAHNTITYVNPHNERMYRIPPGTPISTSTILSNANENIFPEPWMFDPDQWLGDEGRVRRKYMLSFGKGPRLCIGMNLAYAELAVAIAEMANWDMQLYKTDDRDVVFAHNYHVAHARLDSQGVRATVSKKVID